VPPFSDYVARSNKRRRRRRKRLGWLVLVSLAVAGAAWVWWNSGTAAKPAKPATTGEPVKLVPPVVQAPPIAVSNPLVRAVAVVTSPSAPVVITGLPPPAVTSTPMSQFVVRTNVVAGMSGVPRLPRDVLEAQIALARRAFSPGSLDGVMGSQTRAALLAFQQHAGLPQTGSLDADTRGALSLVSPSLTRYAVTSNDLARLQPLSPTWLGKSQQGALDYETILELVAEQGKASPNLIRRLNPGVNWTNVAAGDALAIPDVTCPAPAAKAGFAVITLGLRQLQVFDAATNLLAHFPCSIAARVEKRPAGELCVVAIAENPNYTFNPEVFPESAEARELGRKLILPPGPNNPVGVAWVSLDKPGYGIHGTPSPEQVGRTESHGCFRLANWNAAHFLKLAWIGMPVCVEP
jgi:lipoprotein-anchoring transpeptidase ErfK/SrfK